MYLFLAGDRLGKLLRARQSELTASNAIHTPLSMSARDGSGVACLPILSVMSLCQRRVVSQPTMQFHQRRRDAEANRTIGIQHIARYGIRSSASKV